MLGTQRHTLLSSLCQSDAERVFRPRTGGWMPFRNRPRPVTVRRKFALVHSGDRQQIHPRSSMISPPFKGRGTAFNPTNRFENYQIVREDDWKEAGDPAPTTRFYKDLSHTI